MSPRQLGPALAAGLSLPGSALAHSPIEGIDTFYNGVLHPLFVPAQILLLLAAGLLLGQHGAARNGLPLLVFLAAVILGLGAAWLLPGGGMEAALLAAAAVAGLLVAAKLPLGLAGRCLVALAAGAAVGMDSGQENLAGRDKFVFMLGTGIGICLLFTYAVGLADFLGKKDWQKTAVRVLGSWVAASSLLVLVLAMSARH